MPMSSVITRPTSLPKTIFFQTNPLNNTLITSRKLSHRASLLSVKCSATNNNGGSEQSFNLKEALNDAVGDRVEELLKREENKGLIDGLEKASLRVENAKREVAEIERQELEAKQMRAYVNELEKRASEIEESQKEISEARAIIEEAGRSLSKSEEDSIGGKGIIKKEERVESIKAASIAAIVGTIAGLPIFFAQVSDISQLILPIAITVASCALFGITYRYTIRRDLDDVHLKSGAWAAFGIVKGLGTLSGGQPLELNTESILAHAFDGAIYVSLNLLIFVSATIGLDYCFKMGFLSPFPIKRSISGDQK